MFDLKRTALVGLSCSLFLFFGAQLTFAQEPSATFETSGSTEINETLVLPNQPTNLTGTGEAGAKVLLTALKGNEVIYTQSTVVQPNGEWAIPLPAFSEAPNRFVVKTEIELTPAKIVETVAITGAVTLNGFVVVQMVLERVLRFFQVLGLLRSKTTRGYVFDIVTKKPVPFALMTIENIPTSKNKNSIIFKETVVSDVYGFFKSIDLPAGEYKVNAAHPDFVFPVPTERPWYAPLQEFYRGEVMSLAKQKKLEIIFIPLKSKVEEKPKFSFKHWFNWHVLASIFNQISKALFKPMALVSTVMVVFYPSFINFVMFIFYVLIAVVTLISKVTKIKLAGTVQDEKGQGIAEAVIRIFLTDPYELSVALLTNQKGHFSATLPKGVYQVSFSKDGLIPKTKGMTYEAVDLKKSQTKLVFEMKPVGENPFKAQ